MRILGISCFYHDSAACVLEDGVIVAAAQEERFTRIRHDSAFPIESVRYCLEEAGGIDQPIDAVAFYDKPLLTFHRLLETYLSIAPEGFEQFVEAMPNWLQTRIWVEPQIAQQLDSIGVAMPEDVYFLSHHESHAASAFFPSPYKEAAVLTIDGVGEWDTATVAVGKGNELKIVADLQFPHSLGLLYSAFTYFTGFRVNSGEYKLMGLAPYGEPVYYDLIIDNLMDLKEDGSFRLEMDYFAYLGDLKMINEKFSELFGFRPRNPEGPIEKRYMDVAASIQKVTEEVVVRIARHVKETTGMRHLCLAGGVALNCVANGKIVESGLFEDVWIQPAAGDAGGAVGAALAVWHSAMGKERIADDKVDNMQGSLLGPEFSRDQIKTYLDHMNCVYEEFDEDEKWTDSVASKIADQKVIGMFRGRMEFGPRALGARSILGDPRSAKMQSIVNLKIKYRESFRPFAPACLAEDVAEYFVLDQASPYMLLVSQVHEKYLREDSGKPHPDDLTEWVNQIRSDFPAITHVDGSARVQSVTPEWNPYFHGVISRFKDLTGCPMVINTSFNVRGEPIVCTPEDAYKCFRRTEMDVLAIGPFVLEKSQQPEWTDPTEWMMEFTTD